MYLFLLGILLGAIGICYATKASSIDLTSIAYLSSEIERHEFLACYFRKMLQSANERANLTGLDSLDGGKKENNVRNKNNKNNVEDAADESIMLTLLKKIDDQVD